MATAITPNTDLFLLKCPIESDNNHQLNFASKTAQYNYFHSLPKLEFEKFSYQRKDGVIRIDEHIDNIIQYNYVMYRNTNYGNKWFYAFITKMEYVNDNVTFVSIKTDVLQTWWFDLQFKKSFVEREHVNNDTFGLHTLEEELPAGEWKSNGATDITITDPKNCFVAVMVTELLPSLANHYPSTAGKKVYGGIPNGCYILMCDTELLSVGKTSYDNLALAYDHEDKADAIVAMYLVPKSIMGTAGTDYLEISIELEGGYAFDGFIAKPTTGAKTVSTTTVSRNTTIDGYTPKNAKCFTKQFNYLLALNNVGGSATYFYEDFNGTPSFKFIATYQQTIPSKLVPTNYKGTTDDSGYMYGLTGAPFPVVSWNSDYYLNWQASNGWGGAQTHAQNVSNLIQKGGRASSVEESSQNASEFMSEFGKGLITTMRAIGNTISGSAMDAERRPDESKGDATNADLTFSYSKCEFTILKMSAKAEVIKVVDDYFSAYGYKVSTYKVPNITGRTNWNYVKLIEANIIGDIPQDDMQEIKSYFNRGITIWHNPNTYLDYNQSNTITS